jgi:hypothetical protein
LAATVWVGCLGVKTVIVFQLNGGFEPVITTKPSGQPRSAWPSVQSPMWNSRIHLAGSGL